MTDDELRALAEAQRDAYARMIEIGRGVGGLGVAFPDSFADMLTWQNATENEHADTVLALLDRVERAEGYRKVTVTDADYERAAKAAWVAFQPYAEWAKAVVDDVFSPADDWPKEAIDMLNVARAAIEAALSTEGSSDE